MDELAAGNEATVNGGDAPCHRVIAAHRFVTAQPRAQRAWNSVRGQHVPHVAIVAQSIEPLRMRAGDARVHHRIEHAVDRRVHGDRDTKRSHRGGEVQALAAKDAPGNPNVLSER